MVLDVCVVPTLIELQEQYRHSGLLALLEQRLYFKNNSRRNFLPFPSCCRSEVRRWPAQSAPTTIAAAAAPRGNLLCNVDQQEVSGNDSKLYHRVVTLFLIILLTLKQFLSNAKKGAIKLHIWAALFAGLATCAVWPWSLYRPKRGTIAQKGMFESKKSKMDHSPLF